MELNDRAVYCSLYAVAVLFCSSAVFAGDIVHRDDVAPARPGCDNNFVLVKNKNPIFLFFFYHF